MSNPAESFNFFDPDAEIVKINGAFLPHWHQAGTLYFVTFRLADSIPQEKLQLLSEERDLWHKENPMPHTREQRTEYYRQFPARFEEWLDSGYGSMILADREANKLVCNALVHFDGDRYQLEEFVVAANHVHVLVAPRGSHPLSTILHSWKSFTAKELLKLPITENLATTPTVWQQESWDHIVRSEGSLEKFREYIRGHEDRKCG
ncbi:MAG: transposase [Verrucomicrobiota bacterium]